MGAIRMSVFAMVVGLLGCGGGGSSGGGGTDRNAFGACTSMTGQSCTGVDAYDSCIEAHCGSQLTTCFGAGYKDGDFGGECESYVSCALGCGCTDTACLGRCAQSLSAACTSCLTTVASCELATSCTPPVCK